MNFYDYFFLNSKLNVAGRHEQQLAEEDDHENAIRRSIDEYSKSDLRRSFDRNEKHKVCNKYVNVISYVFVWLFDAICLVERYLIDLLM